jgi:hypothetical protein
MCVVIAVANLRRSVPQLELLVMHFILLYEIGWMIVAHDN